jgi:hypothetical protein
MTDEDEYKVGYGRPPLDTRFKSGQSGNPKGRPKKPRPEIAIKRVLREVLGETVKVNGKDYGPVEIVVRNLLNKAMKGELPAIKTIIDLQDKLGLDMPEKRTGVLKVPKFVSKEAEEAFTKQQQAKFRGEDPEGLAALNAPWEHLYNPPKKTV